MNNDNELGYKLAMVMMTGHSVRDDEGSTAYFQECLHSIKRHICPNMNVGATANRIIDAITKADASWKAFFERRQQASRTLCSWCKTWVASDGIRQKLTDKEYEATTKDPNQSHGICKQCADAMRVELEACRRKER